MAHRNRLPHISGLIPYFTSSPASACSNSQAGATCSGPGIAAADPIIQSQPWFHGLTRPRPRRVSEQIGEQPHVVEQSRNATDIQPRFQAQTVICHIVWAHRTVCFELPY